MILYHIAMSSYFTNMYRFDVHHINRNIEKTSKKGMTVPSYFLCIYGI